MGDEELAKHATTVMEALDESICSLDKTDYFVEYLEQVGAQHSKIPNFKREYFLVIRFSVSLVYVINWKETN